MSIVPWAPAAKMTEAERRADHARHLFEWEMLGREQGTGADPRQLRLGPFAYIGKLHPPRPRPHHK